MAFTIHVDSYKPVVMFFGMTNLPATFQDMMNEILRDMINKEKVTAFVDDVLVKTETEKGYNEIVDIRNGHPNNSGRQLPTLSQSRQRELVRVPLIDSATYMQMLIYKYLPSYFISHIPFESQCLTCIQYYIRKEKEIK